MDGSTDPVKRWPPSSGLVLALFALTVLALAWGEVFAPLARSPFPIRLTDNGSGPAIAQIQGPLKSARAVSVGDAVDLSGLTLSDRIRLLTGSPAGTVLTIPVKHEGRWTPVTVVSSMGPLQGEGWQMPFLLGATLTLLVVSAIAARRPSLATAALVFYGAGAVTTGNVVAQFSWLPNPLFGVAGTVILAALSDLPLFALLVFVTRFPDEPRSFVGRLRLRIGDSIFVVATVIVVVATLTEPVVFASWATAHAVFDGLGALLIGTFAVLAYREASGEDQRRIGWVLAGFLVSIVSYFAFQVLDAPRYVYAGSITLGVLRILALPGQAALPLALAYAVLRHRVIDVGFALNRAVVYGVITAAVVVVVSVVDWLCGMLLHESRLALALEALVAVSFGIGLNFLHRRIERTVDRIVFRQRYIAEERITNRIAALAFATSESAIDAALTDDAASVLRLRSAAVFRPDPASGTFGRRQAVKWPVEDALALDENSLLVRTIRALERPIFLADLAIVEPVLPAGAFGPVFAVPIATQHELLGFVLYGNQLDGASPDPEVVTLLTRLASAAGNAYTVVEARHWRDRASELERAIGAI